MTLQPQPLVHHTLPDGDLTSVVASTQQVFAQMCIRNQTDILCSEFAFYHGFSLRQLWMLQDMWYYDVHTTGKPADTKPLWTEWRLQTKRAMECHKKYPEPITVSVVWLNWLRVSPRMCAAFVQNLQTRRYYALWKEEFIQLCSTKDQLGRTLVDWLRSWLPEEEFTKCCLAPGFQHCLASVAVVVDPFKHMFHVEMDSVMEYLSEVETQDVCALDVE